MPSKMLLPPRCWLLGLFSVTALTFSITSAKIYDRCELARELHDRFKFSKRDLDKWLCLAYWESRFDTRAYHKGRYDGSGDHGIFQINDKYWCQPYTGYSENVCKVPCYMLRDDNLEDDIQCVNKIFRRHGFHAWMMFTHKCSGNTLEFFNGCDIKSRKGPLPRFDTQSSSISPTYVRRPNQTAEDMEPSATSHEALHTSAEESIHTTGGEYPLPKYTSVPSHSASHGYTAYSSASVPVQSNLYRQASIPQTVHIPAPHVGGGVSLMSPSMGSQGLYLNGQSLSSQAFGTAALSGHSQLGNPLGFSPDMSLFSSSSSLTPQASQLTPLVEAPKSVPKPAKPGVIQRLQGALRPPFRVRPVLSIGLGRSGRQMSASKVFNTVLGGKKRNLLGSNHNPLVDLRRVPFRTSGRAVAVAGSAPAPMIVPPAPLIPGYGAPILVPVNRMNSNLDKRKSNNLRLPPTTTTRPVDPLIQALNAPFKSSQKKKPADDSEEDQVDEEDKRK
ncbi:uncharacterized protein LOC108864256 [Galendromus occidentalis]|uniref:lysozyme n=1 Tax=Galendromus occidentalis TaxID=34638 RepID=A0AAJ7WHM8_9ACAR|nr:uncharacterized protein LOC108864256 [Galendromus occidentalis]